MLIIDIFFFSGSFRLVLNWLICGCCGRVVAWLRTVTITYIGYGVNVCVNVQLPFHLERIDEHVLCSSVSLVTMRSLNVIPLCTHCCCFQSTWFVSASKQKWPLQLNTQCWIYPILLNFVHCKCSDWVVYRHLIQLPSVHADVSLYHPFQPQLTVIIDHQRLFKALTNSKKPFWTSRLPTEMVNLVEINQSKLLLVDCELFDRVVHRRFIQLPSVRVDVQLDHPIKPQFTFIIDHQRRFIELTNSQKLLWISRLPTGMAAHWN